MSKILLQGTADHHLLSCEYNMGGVAVATATSETLRYFFPGAEISSLVQFSTPFSTKNNIRIIKANHFLLRHYSFAESVKSNFLFSRALLWAFSRKYLHINAEFLINNQRLKEYSEADFIVDISMDCFNTDFGTFPVFDHCRDILMGKVLGKPVIIYAQSPGPFNSWLSRWAACFALNQASLITIRDEPSLNYIRKIGVKKPPVHLTSDPAFLFKSTTSDRVNKIITRMEVSNKPLIAIVPPDGIVLNTQKSLKGYQKLVFSSFLLVRYFLPEKLFIKITNTVKSNKRLSGFRSTRRKTVCSVLAKVADELVNEYDVNIVLVPHIVMPDDYVEKDNDARTTVREIYDLVSSPKRILAITDVLTAEETKSIIGQCDAIITSKMHAGIAATSQGIPTIVISGPHHKFKGIMGSLGMEEWVLDRFAPDLIIDTFQKLWSQKDQIKASLEERMIAIQEQSMLNGNLIKELLKTTGKSIH